VSVQHLGPLTVNTEKTQGDHMSEEAKAHEFYANPEHLAAAGRGQQRHRPMKSAMTPVRFSPEMIAAVKHFASLDGVTVSTWIRRLVGRELQRRQPPATAPASTVQDVTFEYFDVFNPQSETVSVMPQELVGLC